MFVGGEEVYLDAPPRFGGFFVFAPLRVRENIPPPAH
jgi:hypothetical protein